MIQVVAANVRIELPAGLEEEELTEAGPGSGRVGRPSGPAGERPEELLPDLIRFLQGHPEIKAVPKLVQVRMPGLTPTQAPLAVGPHRRSRCCGRHG